MSNSQLKLCLIGLGRAGGFHLQSLRMMNDAAVGCVYDVDAARAKSIAEQHGCDAVGEVEEGIERKDIDGVIVATPTETHLELVRRCLDAKKPVMTEKPLSRRLQDIDECFETATASGTPLFVAFQRRFDPSFAALIQAVRDREIGQLQYLRTVSRDNPAPSPDYIRISGGIFHDCMVHDLDMIAHIVDEVPTHMSAFGSSFIPEIGACDDFDNVVATLFFPSGVTAAIDVNRKSAFGYDQRIEAFGDGGMIQADNRHQTTLTQADQRGFHRPRVDYSFPTRYREAYMAELQYFVRCARGDAASPITHADVRNNHLLASGLEVAAREKRVVRFDEIEASLL